MIITILNVTILSFIVIVGTNTYAQSDKSMERQQISSNIAETETEGANLTDEMKYLCIKTDTSGSIEQLKNKEQQADCKKFLDSISIHELRELIDKYLEVEDN